MNGEPRRTSLSTELREDPYLEREHVSTYSEIHEELTRRFRITHEQRWPLPGLPIALNLVVGLTLTAK